MINVLISGSSGFVGQNLIKHLSSAKFNICSVNRSVSPSESESGNHFNWESLWSERFDSFDVVIHLAGKAHDTKGRSNSGEYFEINTELTKKLFDAFLNSTAITFIFMSSVKAVAD